MSSFELFFDDDEDKILHLALKRKRKVLRDSSNPLELHDHIITKACFQDLLKEVSIHLKAQRRLSAIPNILKLAAMLRFLAEGGYQRGAGNDFFLGIAQPTMSLTLKEMLTIMENHICSKWISFNYSEEEKRTAKLYFFQKCQIPGVVGCVDGTHIRIIKPEEDVQHLYYNRKGYHSLNVMIVCDHQQQIRYINAKYPGACHDSMIWNVSGVKRNMETLYENGDKNSRLLGDAGYPLQPILLTPVRDPEHGTPQSRYNESHSKGRNIVERTIGLLKARFRCLLSARQLHYTPKKATQITNVCAALHNMCIKYRIEEPDNEGLESEAIILNANEAEDDAETEEEGTNEAITIRNKIIQTFQ